MRRDLQGKYETISTAGETARAFIPSPLPPIPPIEWSSELREKFDQALLALGRLDSVCVLLPDTSLFLYMYVRKEAVLSSMIEGTQSSLSDLLMFEFEHQPGVPLNDVQEVSNYVSALYYGLQRLNEEFPLSLRLIHEIHAVLLSKGRGAQKEPGEFRRSQNWIGGSRPGNAIFVPPPPEKVLGCMGKLELFLHDLPDKTPVIVKAALAHVQFESIHPFLDGNGRLGRLLITLIFCSNNILKEPMLYLSLYFKTHRDRYYQLLNNVRLTGDWESWLAFFADAVIETATQAVNTAQQLMKLASDDGNRINQLKRISGSANLVHKAMLERPMASPNWIKQKTQLSQATVNACLRELVERGIVREVTGQKRNRLYSYFQYINIMNQGTELPGK
jgi:Fic family protein